jgi:hypothetical protein
MGAMVMATVIIAAGKVIMNACVAVIAFGIDIAIAVGPIVTNNFLVI